MRVGDIKNRVLSTFGDIDSIQVTDDDIIRWVNDGQRELGMRYELKQVKATHDIVGSEANYTLPTYVYKVYSVLVDNKALVRIPIQEYTQWEERNTEEGTPFYYTVWDRTLILGPTPDKSKTNGLTIYYVRLPLPVTSMNDEPTVPVEYFNTLTEYVLGQAYLLDNDKDGYNLMMGKFNATTSDIFNDQVTDKVDVYPSIREEEYD